MKFLREAASLNTIFDRQNIKRDLKSKLKNLPSAQDANHNDSFKNYKMGSKRINSYLWRQHMGENPEGHEDSKKHIANLDSEISQHKLPKMTVWSGTKHDPRSIKNSEDIVHHPAFLSTSLDPYVAHSFAYSHGESIDKNRQATRSHTLKIHIPEGHPGIHNDPMGGSYESEVLLPRGLNLKYKKTTSFETHEWAHNNQHLIHHMEIV